MDAATLREAMRAPNGSYSITISRAQELLPHVEDALRKSEATTINRIAMWCAQIGTESAGLLYMKELGGPEYFAQYNNRKDLGNGPTDGPRYPGRGPIQVTGRHNYTQLSIWCAQQGYTSNRTLFVDRPELLEELRYGFLGAVWYWRTTRRNPWGKYAKAYNLNEASDMKNVTLATELINGGQNGLADRQARFNRCLQLGNKLLLGKEKEVQPIEKVLPYSRDAVRQDTGYNCGPASTQTIILSKTGVLHPESTLGRKLGTYTGGTDYIGQFPAVLNAYLENSKYVFKNMPNDPPTATQKNALWDDVVNSINGGYGVVANIVSPPSNRPRHSYKSNRSPNYGSGTVYHYVAIMGYAVDSFGKKHFWVADSGFDVTGYWITFEQMASLIPPKGYAYASAKAVSPVVNGLTKEEEMELLKLMKDVIVRLERIEKNTNLDLDQSTGPGKDSKGRTFSGWKEDDLREVIANKKKSGRSLTQAEQIFSIYEAISKEKK